MKFRIKEVDVMIRFLCVMSIVALCFSGCVSTNSRVLESSQSQLAIRSIQTRVFDTEDKDNVLRNIAATMQDLGFIIEKADGDLGTITGFSFKSKTTLTASVRAQGKQTLVRINAEKGTKSIKDPQAYQNFFNALAQSLFLTANEVL